MCGLWLRSTGGGVIGVAIGNDLMTWQQAGCGITGHVDKDWEDHEYYCIGCVVLCRFGCLTFVVQVKRT